MVTRKPSRPRNKDVFKEIEKELNKPIKTINEKMQISMKVQDNLWLFLLYGLICIALIKYIFTV